MFIAALALTAASNDPKAEKDILATMDLYKDAMIHNNAGVLDKLLSADLAFTHSHGEFQSKADVLRAVTTGKNVIVGMEFSDTTVRIYGNTALVKGRVDLWHSETNLVPMNVLHVWVHGPQGWQLVARQATLLRK
jgi:Domain of unknown function (DUF4440)